MKGESVVEESDLLQKKAEARDNNPKAHQG
jgi:hypothetical protein